MDDLKTRLLKVRYSNVSIIQMFVIQISTVKFLNVLQGVNKTSEKVTIHNKNYQPPPATPKPCMGKFKMFKSLQDQVILTYFLSFSLRFSQSTF